MESPVRLGSLRVGATIRSKHPYDDVPTSVQHTVLLAPTCSMIARHPCRSSSPASAEQARSQRHSMRDSPSAYRPPAPKITSPSPTFPSRLISSRLVAVLCSYTQIVITTHHPTTCSLIPVLAIIATIFFWNGMSSATVSSLSVWGTAKHDRTSTSLPLSDLCPSKAPSTRGCSVSVRRE